MSDVCPYAAALRIGCNRETKAPIHFPEWGMESNFWICMQSSCFLMVYTSACTQRKLYKCTSCVTIATSS